MTTRYPELTQARLDMKAQGPLYQPTLFWDDVSARLVEELESFGIERLRALPSALYFFAPTYGSPGSSFSVEHAEALQTWFRSTYPEARKPQLALEQFLTGDLAAMTEYRVLLAADRPGAPVLTRFSESEFGSAVEQFEFDGRRFSRSSLNYLLGLAFFKQHANGDVPATVLEIGGGFGTLGEILSGAEIPGLRYIDIDIPPTSYIAEQYLSHVLGPDRVANYAQTRDRSIIEIDSLPPAAVLCSWQIERLRGQVDLFVNFISFQEMEPPVVRNYLHHVSRLETRWVLLRNLREGMMVKRSAGGLGVSTPIRSDDYAEMLPSYRLVSRNVLPFGHRTMDGFHSELLLFKRRDG